MFPYFSNLDIFISTYLPSIDMNTNQNNDGVNNNNDMSERRQGVFGSLDLLTERSVQQAEDLFQIGNDLYEIQKEVHRREIAALDRQWNEKLQEIADAVEEFAEKNLFASTEDLEQLRALITRK